MANETKINTDIWGEESEWIDVNNPPTLPYSLSTYIAQSSLTGLQRMQAKIPYLKKATGATAPLNEYWRMQWRGLFLASDAVDEDNIIEKLSEPMPPEDFPVVWGLGKNSPGANSYYIYPQYIAGSNMFTEPAGGVSYCYKGLNTLYSPSNLDGENDWTDAKTIPFCFTSQLNTSPAYGVKFQQRNYQMGVGQSYISSVNNLSGNPILSFNYQNVVIYPLLAIAKENENSNYGYDFQFNVTIGAYFDGVNYDPDAGTGTPPLQQTYPYICCVYVGDIRIGANDGTTRSSNNGGSIFGGVAPGLFDLDEIQATEMLYKNQVKLWTTQLLSKYQGRNQFQTIQQSVLMGGIISGALNGATPYYSFTMQTNSRLDTPQKAWIALTADSTSPTLPVFFQNGHYEPVLRQRRNLSNPSASYTQYLDFIPLWHDATKEDVLKDVAYLGFWFSEDATVAGSGATGETCNSPLMHIPIFDEYGITTGEYKSGTDAALEDNAKWQDPFKDNPYKPGDGDHDNDDNDFGNLNNGGYRGVNFYNLKMYALTEVQLLQFLSTVNALYTDDTDAVQMDLDFKGSNPNEYIVGVYGYPFDIPNQESLTTIKLGPVDTGVQCRSVSDNFYGELSFGDIYIAPYYNDFRDYEPYTTIEMFVPLCGTVKLDPALYVGHTVRLYYDFDPATGNLTAKICRDDLIDKVIDGSICVQIPITATNMGDYQRSIHQIKSRILQTAIGAAQQLTPSASFAMAAATENIGGMVSNAPQNPISVGIDVGLKAREIRYDMTHNAPHVSVTGTADPLNAINMDNHAYVFIKRAKMIQGYDADIYSHTVGNACLIQSKIKDMSGLIKCSNVDLSGIPATAEELNAIQTALQNGVYV